MSDYKKTLVNSLIDEYERKVVQLGRPCSTIKLNKVFPQYQTENISNDDFMGIESAVFDLLRNNLIIAEKEGFSTSFNKIKLKEGTIDTLYRMVKRPPIGTIAAKKRAMLKKYEGKDAITDRFINALLVKVNEFKFTELLGDDEKLENVLRGMVGVVTNTGPLLYRQFSVLTYGDSKIFEKNYIGIICSKLYEYGNFECVDREDKAKILDLYDIHKVNTQIRIKGNAVIKINNQVIDISSLQGGIGISSEDLDNINEIEIRATQVYTIENLTSFETFSIPDSFSVYLAGFHNTAKNNFLKKIYEGNRSKKYFHFGDIDAGGFYIFLNLCAKSEIPFVPYKMDVDTLKNPDYTTKNLEGNDKKRLTDLLEKNTIFSETIKYMLANNCKLEQETISD